MWRQAYGAGRDNTRKLIEDTFSIFEQRTIDQLLEAIKRKYRIRLSNVISKFIRSVLINHQNTDWLAWIVRTGIRRQHIQRCMDFWEILIAMSFDWKQVEGV